MLDIKNGIAGICQNNTKMKLFDVIDIYGEKKTKTTLSDDDPNRILRILKKHLTKYKGDQVLIKDVDKNFCIGFMEYLRRYRMHRKGQA